MKQIFLTISLMALASALNAQADDKGIPVSTYQQHIYNPQTNSINPSYNYSGKWDLDGDQKFDSLYFIGNGGAHTYYFLRIILSSDHRIKDYYNIQIDMLYIGDTGLLKTSEPNAALQFVPGDFDDNGTIDLYLNFDNPFGKIPKKWRKEGIREKRVILNFAGTSIKVKNP